MGNSLQLAAKHPETFAPNVISFTHAQYEDIITGMSLPTRAIEMTASVGLHFWWEYSNKQGRDGVGKRAVLASPKTQQVSKGRLLEPRLTSADIIFRKADARWYGMSRGWELLLHHDLETHLTTGFYKGTPTSKAAAIVDALKACDGEVHNVLLLPLLIMHFEGISGTNAEQTQRKTREWLKRLEAAIAIKKDGDKVITGDMSLDTDIMSEQLSQCFSRTVWNNSREYVRNLEELESLLEKVKPWSADERTHLSFASRINSLKRRFENLDTYAETTKARLGLQRDAVSEPPPPPDRRQPVGNLVVATAPWLTLLLNLVVGLSRFAKRKQVEHQARRRATSSCICQQE